MTILTNYSEIELQSLAQKYTKIWGVGDVVLMNGPMGAGKTTFVRLFAESLNIKGVCSPSYTLINHYQGPIKIIHIDLYRLNHSQEIESLEIEPYFDQALTFIEWAEKLGPLTPKNAIIMSFEFKNGERSLKIESKD